ncbi:MAG: 2-aminoethylphosphonate--pyruvate transaminase [Acetobacteraceae bacterium]|nr:2-aminoethylphosphonate--pyruvate transaminase [Acetobacteraceae bacterium]
MLLLIPGPVMTRPEVRAAAGVDIAPWDFDFLDIYATVRARLLKLAHGTGGTHTVLPLPGCGHFITEAAIRSFIPPGGRLLIPMTGSYSDRMVRLAREAGRDPVPLPIVQMEKAPPAVVAAALERDPTIMHVGLVQSETGSGIAHDIDAIGAAVHAAGRRMIVDAVSAFGALPLDMTAHPEIDAAVFTANKCLEGLPGIAYVIARIDRLEQCAGVAGSWSFDLSDIYTQVVSRGDGRPRFTPPAQIINALHTALDFLEQEGGPAARLVRYTANMRTLYDGMIQLGLTPFVQPDHQGPIIVNMCAPADPAWNLQHFVDALKRRGVLISNFYNTPKPGFRIGCIGAITPPEMAGAVATMDQALNDIGVKTRAGETP